jgi:hypothetical protein
MGTNVAEVLSRSVCDTLQKVAFVFPEPAGKEALPPFRGPCILARMRFGGCGSGELALAAPAALCHTLAANILGVEREDQRANELGEDAFKEILDNLCAHLLLSLAGPEALFDLGLPVQQNLSLAELDAFLEDPQSCGFSVEDQPVLARLVVEA